MSTAALHYDPLRKVINGGGKCNFGMDARGIGYLLFDSMRKWSKQGRTAQIDAATGLEDMYEDLFKRCVRTAIGMRKLGMKKGDIIGIHSYNHMNSVVPLLAGFFIDVITAPTDPLLNVDDTRYLLEMVKPKLVFTSAECEQVIENALKDCDQHCKIITFAKESSKYMTFDWFLQQDDEENQFEPDVSIDLKATCLILFSSGTTGLPKGMCLNHEFVCNLASGLNDQFNHSNVFMNFASLYWISTIMIATSCIIMGNLRLLCFTFKPELIWENIENYKVDYVFVSPVQAIKTTAHLSDKGKNLSTMIIGGGQIAPAYIEALRNNFPDAFIINSYGQTEIGVISLLKIKDKNYRKLRSCGQPVSGLQLRIVDPETEEVLDLNREGEIRIKPMYPINGYYYQDSSAVWDAEGYMKTGDLGYFDDDLCLFITNRAKEIFKYMSYHIVPAKLETILQSHPAVELAVVIGLPHTTDDNHALGVVTLQEGAHATSKELEKYVEDRVDELHRLRAGVLILEINVLPMTPSGKIKRRELQEIILKQRIRA